MPELPRQSCNCGAGDDAAAHDPRCRLAPPDGMARIVVPLSRRSYSDDDMRRIEEGFADSVARVPADEPLMEGLVKRAKTEGLQRIVDRHDGDELGRLAQAELERRHA